jgi:hypothetical protein
MKTGEVWHGGGVNAAGFVLVTFDHGLTSPFLLMKMAMNRSVSYHQM